MACDLVVRSAAHAQQPIPAIVGVTGVKKGEKVDVTVRAVRGPGAPLDYGTRSLTSKAGGDLYFRFDVSFPLPGSYTLTAVAMGNKGSASSDAESVQVIA